MKSLIFLCFVCLSVIEARITTERYPHQVVITTGEIRGERLKLNVEEYTVFKGIPYAAPPVGSLRFQRAVSPARYRGVMNTTQYSPMCMQRLSEEKKTGLFLNNRMSEDCLYINVFCKPPPYREPPSELMPVIVFIHGGGFQTGSSSEYEEEPILRNFVSRNVVFVTFNYRLGPFGFLTTGDETLPGNMGLWDMVLALEWVQNNIQSFGGDPHNVTLMGQGSGAAAASILSLSPRASDLIHRVILMSGTAVSPGAVRSVAVNATWNLGKKLCGNDTNSEKLLSCLSSYSGRDIIEENITRVFYDDYQEWVPVIDGFGGIIPESPELLVSYRRKVPAIIGTTRDESALKLIIVGKQGLNISELSRQDTEYWAQNLTKYEGFTNHQLIKDGCIYEYVQTRMNPSSTTKDLLKNVILEMYSNFWYNAPASNMASNYARSHADAYLYSFDHVSVNIFAEHADWIGSFHGSELMFLFDTKVANLQKRTDSAWQLDRRVAEYFVELITNFAKTGDPTQSNVGLSFNWAKFNGSEFNFLSLTDFPKMEVGYNWRGHVFWNWYAKSLDTVDFTACCRRLKKYEDE